MIEFERYGLPWGHWPAPTTKWGTNAWYAQRRAVHEYAAKFAHDFY